MSLRAGEEIARRIAMGSETLKEVFSESEEESWGKTQTLKEIRMLKEWPRENSPSQDFKNH
jgi:hypothetical protein